MSMLDAYGDGTWPHAPVKLDLRKADQAEVGEYWIAPFGGVYRRIENGWVGVPTGSLWMDAAGLEISDWKRATATEAATFRKAEGRKA